MLLIAVVAVIAIVVVVIAVLKLRKKDETKIPTQDNKIEKELPKGEKYYQQSLRKAEEIKTAEEKLAALSKNQESNVESVANVPAKLASDDEVKRPLSQGATEVATKSQGPETISEEYEQKEVQKGGFVKTVPQQGETVTQVEPKVEVKAEVAEPKVEPKQEVKQTEVKAEVKPSEVKTEAKPEVKPSEVKTEVKAEVTPVIDKSKLRRLSKKICLIGDGGSGKTTLIRKFVFDMFDDKYIHTIGTKVTKKVVMLPEENIELTLMIWDIQGQKNDLGIKTYMEGAEGALVVSDVTRLETLDHVPDWIVSFFEVAGQVPVVLLGNKSDLVDKMLFGEDELKFLCNKLKKQGYNAQSMLTSAKTGLNVELAFKTLGKEIVKK
jgi:small GTP-binding protein